jgi:hypothetical protein
VKNRPNKRTKKRGKNGTCLVPRTCRLACTWTLRQTPRWAPWGWPGRMRRTMSPGIRDLDKTWARCNFFLTRSNILYSIQCHQASGTLVQKCNTWARCNYFYW